MDNIDSNQIRAARGLLNWSQDRLAEVSEVARASIKNIETGVTLPRQNTMDAIKYAFEKYGVEFMPGSGVRLKSRLTTVIEGENSRAILRDRVYETMKGTNGEVLIACYREPNPVKEPERYKNQVAHMERMAKADIKSRFLIKEGDRNFIYPWDSYRWMPAEYFSPYPFVIYKDNLAMISMKRPERVIIIHDQLFVESFSKLFEFIWSRSVLTKNPDRKK